jgi:hypothetical protein
MYEATEEVKTTKMLATASVPVSRLNALLNNMKLNHKTWGAPDEQRELTHRAVAIRLLKF